MQLNPSTFTREMHSNPKQQIKEHYIHHLAAKMDQAGWR